MTSPRSHSLADSEPDPAKPVSPAVPRDPRLVLLDDIDRSIAKARELNLNRLALFLNVARLELKTQIYNVSDDELRMLSMATRQDLIIEDP